MLLKELSDTIKEIKIDDYVEITSGSHKGKPGYVNKLDKNNGKIQQVEIQLEDDDDVYIWLKPDQVKKIED